MINEYLNEENLYSFLKERFKTDIIKNETIPTIKRRFKPDFRIEEKKLIIEFDGYGHYTSPENILRDIEKDEILLQNKYEIIRIPYFIQLDEKVIKHLFGNYITNKHSFNDYPHGFIDKKVICPASFCELGINKFLKDLDDFYYIKDDIIQSLKNKIEEKKKELLVLPPSLLKII